MVDVIVLVHINNVNGLVTNPILTRKDLEQKYYVRFFLLNYWIEHGRIWSEIWLEKLIMNRQKIMAIIYKVRKDDLYFLALRNNPSDKRHGGDYYFVVTGYVNKNEKLEDAVKREIKEETGISNILDITDMNKIYNYDWDGDKCEEHVFSVKIDDEVKKLNYEHIGFKWLKKEYFIKIVNWDNKNDLKQILREISK